MPFPGLQLFDNTKKIEFRLSPRQRKLIIKYGYPFEDLARQLNRLTTTPRHATVTINPSYLHFLIADLVRSAKQLDDQALLNELDELLTDLEDELLQAEADHPNTKIPDRIIPPG